MATSHTPDRSLRTTASAPREREPRIAVVAVHGVADQKPGETAAAVAGLLLSLDPSKRSRLDPHSDIANEGRTRTEPGASYAGFEERACRMPLRPLSVGALETPAPPTELLVGRTTQRETEMFDPKRRRSISFDERRGYIAELRENAIGSEKPSDDDKDRVGLEYLRLQLAEYRGSDATASYETVRLEGRRGGSTGPVVDRTDLGASGSANGPAKARDSIAVHVYEMYWADLSRLGSGPVKFFSALYQLLGHLASLGRQAIDAARSEQPAKRWSVLQWLHTWVIRLLVLFVPVCNVILLVTGLSVIPAERIDARFARGAAVAIAAALGIVIAYRLLRARPLPRRPITWALAPIIASFVAGGVVAVVVNTLITSGFADNKSLLIFEWWVAAGALTWVTMRLYARVRPGAVFVGMTAFVVALCAYYAYTLYLRAGSNSHAEETAAFWAMQVVFMMLALTWRVLFLFTWLALVVGIWCAFQDRRAGASGEDRYARTRAVLRTAQLTIAITASAYIFGVIIVWSGIFRFTVQKLDAFACVAATPAPFLSWIRWLMPTPEQIAHWLPAASLAPSEPQCLIAGLTARQYFGGLLASSVTTGIAPALILQTAALFLLVWMALPSIKTEVDAPSKCTNREASQQGQWLSRGLDATGFVTWLLWLSTFIVIPGFAVLDWWHRLSGVALGTTPEYETLPVTAKATLFFIQLTGGLFAASAVVILSAVAKFGGSALDLILDVDNYLSTGPVEATPAARIMERYASLFRYLANYSEAGRGYDAVVIIAHSLGTTVTADVLRVLHRQACGDALAATTVGPLDDQLAPIFAKESPQQPAGDAPTRLPIYLFTMGSPLRQLMNRFFPHRFWWVRDEPDNGRQPLAGLVSRLTRKEIAGESPSPAKLGVASWSNAYRSGDYVGRSIWVGEWYHRTNGGDDAGGYPDPITVAADDNAWEACIGLGAHTHYWDGSAPDVATRLDELIVMAASSARARAQKQAT